MGQLSRIPGLQYLGIRFLCPFNAEFTTPDHTTCPARFTQLNKRHGDYNRCSGLMAWVGQYEHAAMAERMATAITSLEYISLELRPKESRYWTIVREPEMVAVTPVAADEVGHMETVGQHEKYTLGAH